MNIQKSQYQSAIITAVISVIILLLLFLITITAERNEMDEGVMVSFGDVDDGFGEQTPAPEDPAAAAAETSTATTPQTTPQQPSASNEKLVTQEDPSVVMEREKKRKAEAAEAERKRQEAAAAEKARKEAEAKDKTSKIGGNAFRKVGDGQGTGSGDGKKGNPVGKGSAGGNSLYGGRSLIGGKLALPKYSSNESGKIYVVVTIGKDGKVSNPRIGKGTTITDEQLLNAAKEAAKKNTFSPGESSVEGTILYTFNLN